MSEIMDDDRKVWVCAACLCASCWHGEFYCQQYRNANIVEKTVKELNELNYEHPSHYSISKIKQIYGVCLLLILLFAAPVFAAEPMIQFTVSDWKKAIHRIELDQQETKLLRQQNKDLKQLVTLTTEQAQQCEQINKSYDEMDVVSEEYRRSLEAENTGLKSENVELKDGIQARNWVIGGGSAVIVVLYRDWETP